MTAPAERIARAKAELRAVEADLVAALAQDRTRRRAPLVRMLHEVRRALGDGYRYASQAGQDREIDRIFGGTAGGTFVDVGAYDGVTGSNTLFLEQVRGWSGVLVEPVAAQRARAEVARKAPCLACAVAAEPGEADFVEITAGYTQMSGLSASYDAGLLRTVRANPRHAEVTTTVPCRTLSQILDEAGLPDPDFVSLDIEGGELDVLRAFPFDRHRVGAWAIENNAGTTALREIMEPAGYVLVEFCGPDEIYRHRDLDPGR